MKNRPPYLDRRKFLKTGVSSSFLALIFPGLKTFARADLLKQLSGRATDPMAEIAQKYGAEFGGKEAFQKSDTKEGGQNGRI